MTAHHHSALAGLPSPAAGRSRGAATAPGGRGFAGGIGPWIVAPVLGLMVTLGNPALALADDPPESDPAEQHGEDHPHEEGGHGGHGAEEGHGKTGGHGGGKHHSSRLTDERIPLQLEGFPERPKPLLELGEPFLGTGTLKPGFELPTGAVWQPSLLMFGSWRTAVQTFEREGDRVSEAATRLDLFFNLQLSGSERLVVGFQPLQQDGRFTSYIFESDLPGLEDGFEEETSADITSLFFEGDFGEIFPNLSKKDFRATDIGFSIGRQPLLFQEGMLINDTIDGIGLTRNTLQPRNTSNLRATLFWGWNQVGRSAAGGNAEDEDAQLFGLLTSTDLRRSTIDADFVYVTSDDGGDLLSGGISAVQRIGTVNTAFRILGSSAQDEETLAASDGALLFSEVSWTPHYTYDLVYFTTFLAVDRFSSAARGPASGGPLGLAGINFAAVGLGNYGAALSSIAEDVAGGAIGYQKFFDGTRKQVIFEVGGRIGTDDAIANAAAATVRYQAAWGRHHVFVVDGFAGYREALGPGASGDEELFGGRVEWLLKF